MRTGNAAAVGGHLYGITDKCVRCSEDLARGGGAPVRHVFTCGAPGMDTARACANDAAVRVEDLWRRPLEVLRYMRTYLTAPRWPGTFRGES